MAAVKCENCGRVYEWEENGEMPKGAIVDGSPDWEEDCTHCQFCMYDDCHVYLNRPKWWCEECLRSKQSS